MLCSVDLDDDALVIRQQQEEIHALTRQPLAVAQELHYSRVIMKIDLRYNGRERIGELRPIEFEVCIEQIAFGVRGEGCTQSKAECAGWVVSANALDAAPPLDQLGPKQPIAPYRAVVYETARCV